MPREKNLELKVGSVVILGFICLTFFILSVSDFSLLEEKKTMRIIFSFASGLKKSAPVRIAGVDSGGVKEVKLFLEEKGMKTKAEVVIWVRKEFDVPIDSRVLINQLGLFGEKYVEILPGINQKQFYQDGDVIIGVDPILQEEISGKIIDLTVRLNESIKGVNALINDESNQESVRMTLKHLNSLSENLEHITDRIESGEGTIGKLFYDEKLYDDLQALSSDLKANPWKLLYRPKGQK